MQEGGFKIFLCGHRDKKALLSSSASCKKNVFFFFFFWGSRSTPVFLYTYLQFFLSNLAYLNHKPDITMVYSLHGCVHIFILFYFFFGGGERGLPNWTLFTIYIFPNFCFRYYCLFYKSFV